MGFFTVVLKNVNYSLVIIIRFCHWLITHDDKTVISYFMLSHQTLKFSYNFKAKRYNVNLMNKINNKPSTFGRLSVIKWRNWKWWERYLDTRISDETQIAVVVWLQVCLLTKCIFCFRQHRLNQHNSGTRTEHSRKSDTHQRTISSTIWRD